MSDSENAPERVWLNGETGSAICKLDRRDINSPIAYEYLLKSTADKREQFQSVVAYNCGHDYGYDKAKKEAEEEKMKIVQASQYNIDETIEHNYQMGLAKNKDDIEEILKPIRDVYEAYKESVSGSYLESSKVWQAVVQTIEIADNS